METAQDIQMPDLGCVLFDRHKATPDQLQDSVAALNSSLQIDILEKTRPSTYLCRDNDLPILSFVVQAEDEIKGSFVFYNIEYEGDSITAYPMPSFHGWGGIPKHTLWGSFLHYFLRNEITFEDGSTLKLAEWHFPTEDGHEWTARSEEKLPDLLEELVDDVLVLDSQQNPARAFRERRVGPRTTAADRIQDP